MKTKILRAVVVLCTMFASCGDIVAPEKQINSTNSSYNVEKLFTADGITVYRFFDSGHYVYFTNKSGNVSYTVTRRKGNREVIQTLCTNE